VEKFSFEELGNLWPGEKAPMVILISGETKRLAAMEHFMGGRVFKRETDPILIETIKLLNEELKNRKEYYRKQ
jgi:hypothetical protein